MSASYAPLDLDDLTAGHAAARQELAALRKDAERYRKLCEVPDALDVFTAVYHNAQTQEQIDAAMDALPDVGAA